MIRTFGCRVVEAYPHDPLAFTQGLLWHRGALYESTGLVGQSSVRRVRLGDGRVLRSAALPARMFGEGLAARGEEIVSLTYRDGVAFRWDCRTLAPRGEIACPGEAWGLTGDGESLIRSDGTPVLRFLDPATLAERRALLVTAAGRPLGLLNDLQWAGGTILANVLTLPALARIDPASGQVTGWIDLSPLVAECGGGDPEKLANGVAYDAERGRLFVTGKNWPRLYQIAVDPAPR